MEIEERYAQDLAEQEARFDEKCIQNRADIQADLEARFDTKLNHLFAQLTQQKEESTNSKENNSSSFFFTP